MKPLLFVSVFALAVAGAAFASGASPHVIAPGQGWDQATTRKFYHEPQGTILMPAAFLRALRSPGGQPFMAPAHMRSLGFIEDGSAWPVGFAVFADAKTGGIPMVGITCAACHTAQLTYKGTTLRVEGGGANVDLPRFQSELRAALAGAAKDPQARKAFVADALADGYPKAHLAATLDASAERLTALAELAGHVTKTQGPSTPGGPGRIDALTGIAYNAFVMGLGVPGNAKKAIAPVNYPYLWNIWHFDWVQYNASVRQPMARNVGEAIGVGAKLNIVDPKTGALNPEPERWRSSVLVKNLYWMETALAKLQPPVWPAAFGSVDPAQARRGHALFDMYCSRCHAVFKIAHSASSEWSVKAIPLKIIGTDPQQAEGFAATTYDATKLGLSAKLPGAEGLNYVVEHLKDQAYRDAGIPKSEWKKYDGFGRSSPVVAPCGYKARPLVGVWATAPFLHNGSVPSLYDMLSQTRPSHPILGNPNLDPVKVGMAQTATPNTLTLDTALPGNSNAGHWFTNDLKRPGRIGPALTQEQKYDLIAYLKTATYADYPSRMVPAPFPLPCGNDLTWTKNTPY